jgi:hypothetical protein
MDVVEDAAFPLLRCSIALFSSPPELRIGPLRFLFDRSLSLHLYATPERRSTGRRVRIQQ